MVLLCAENRNLRVSLPQNPLQNFTHRVLSFKMPGVDQIQPAVFCLFKLVVLEVCRDERVAARR